MAIQWFPGHMNATKRALSDRIKQIDVVIEMLDARLPGSSMNPLLARITKGKPALKVLNKQDLADPERLQLWLDHYNERPGTRAIGLDASDRAPAQRLMRACRELAPHRGGMVKPLRVLICGIPNVGKSTLMNALAGRKAAKTGDEPGVTKVEQKIMLADDFQLYDTPGMLWPKIMVPESGYKLAASGAVGRNAMDEVEVVLETIKYLRGHAPYEALLRQRFKLDDISALHDDQVLDLIARKRGAVLAGGKLNLQKAAEIVLHDLRTGVIGKLCLETPKEFWAWFEVAKKLEAERLARIEAEREAKRRGTRDGDRDNREAWMADQEGDDALMAPSDDELAARGLSRDELGEDEA